mgnify:CR=1 FL=1
MRHPIVRAFRARELDRLPHSRAGSSKRSRGQDLLDLRHDTTEIRGWWKNRFARILVNFILTNTGTALAVWVAGAAFFIKLG